MLQALMKAMRMIELVVSIYLRELGTVVCTGKARLCNRNAAAETPVNLLMAATHSSMSSADCKQGKQGKQMSVYIWNYIKQANNYFRLVKNQKHV